MSPRDEGSAVPLIVGLFAIAAAFVVIAAAATSLHLHRLRLLTVSDGAALAAAESFRIAEIAVQGDAVVPRLSSGAVRTAADAAVRAAGDGDLDALTVVEAGTSDGRSATVRLRSTWHPPMLSPLLPDGLPVTVTSTAAARFR